MENEAEVAGPRRTLVLFPGALGDAVCFEPAAAWLAREGPVVFCARGAAAEVARLFPCRPETRSLDAPEVARLFAPLEEAPLVSDWLAGFARVVSLTGASSPEVRARIAAVGGVVVPFPRRTGEEHAIDEMLHGVSAGGVTTGVAPCLRPVWVDEPEGARSRLVIHPGSGGGAKRAPRRLFVEIATRWRDRGGEPTFLLGPAEEAERAWWQSRGCSVVVSGSVAEMARRLAEARVFVGNDSGPSHVAAALGTESVVTFRSTDPRRFGARGRRVHHVRLPDEDPAWWEPVWRVVEPMLP